MSTTDDDVTIADDGSFTAPLVLAYPYDRTVGPTIGRFLTGLMEKRIEGTVGSDGRVYVPPAEFDPVTGEPCTEWVTAADTGTVETWSWSADDERAWAMIKLDGADVAMMHRVDVASADDMSTGMRVQAQWADERRGAIDDIATFVQASGDGEAGQ